MTSPYLEKVLAVAESAGKAILEVYGREDFGIKLKDDISPLTHADTAAHRLIVKQLNIFSPELPVLSEESKEAGAPLTINSGLAKSGG